MEISFFSEDDYGKIIGEELQIRGYNVIYDKLTNNTNICFTMCVPSTFKFIYYLQNEYIKNKFKYNGIVVCNVLDLPTWRLNNPNTQDMYNQYREILNSCHYITTISNFTATQLKSIWGLNSKPLFKAFNNKLIDKYKQQVKRENQVICIGRFVPHKRFDLVIKALENTGKKLVIIGKSGELERYYNYLSEQYNVNCEIINNPPFEIIVKQLCKSELCIHPSEFEGLSLVPKEALWCDTPVIISDIAVHREYHKDTVSYFEPGNINSLKQSMNNNIKSPEIGKNEISQYIIEKITDNVEQWLKHLK